MRKETLFRMPVSESLELLSAAPCVYLATTSANGEPILRAMNAAVVGNRLVFHGSPVGEKTEAMGREVVVSAVEIVASIPSYFVDPERACPATTLYRSVQVHGTIEVIDAPSAKAEALRAILAKHQPEGGFVALDPEHPLYRNAIASLLVFGVPIDRLDGKAKLGQNRTPAERSRMVEKMWERGDPSDPKAIDRVLAACAGTPTPGFLRSPPGSTLVLTPSVKDASAVAALLADTYWNQDFSHEEIALAHLGSTAWVCAKDGRGTLIASARALSDGAKRASIYDVIVAPNWRGKGVGDAVMRLLLDHPALRRTRMVHLGTRDAAAFYARLGFRETTTLPVPPYRIVGMALSR